VYIRVSLAWIEELHFWHRTDIKKARSDITLTFRLDWHQFAPKAQAFTSAAKTHKKRLNPHYLSDLPALTVPSVNCEAARLS